MIKFIETKPNKEKSEPYYLLTFCYMVGDADGNERETMKISKENPYLERFYKLLTSLRPPKGHWGLGLEYEHLDKVVEEGQITEDDYDFLEGLMFPESFHVDEETYFNYDEDEYALEFYEGVRSNTEYSFLTFEGFKLKYVDESGIKHKCEVV